MTRIDDDIKDNPEIWVDKFGDYLYGYAYKRVNDSQIAEDLVQETFLSALKSRNNYTASSTFQSWLVGILKHKIIDYFRKKYKESNSDITDSNNLEKFPDFNKSGKWKGHWIEEHSPIDWGDPHQFLQNKEFWVVFNNCMNKLPDKIASVFILHQVDGIPTSQICNDLEISSTNLWVILHRCRKQLRKCLEINWINEPPENEIGKTNE